jgi:hypothetical protein
LQEGKILADAVMPRPRTGASLRRAPPVLLTLLKAPVQCFVSTADTIA